MSRVSATLVPDESDWLCEGCGYVLKGLPTGGNCPECGMPTSQSAAALRSPAAWETASRRSRMLGFLATSSDVLFHPTRFYRSLATRFNRRRSMWFAQIYWAAASALFGLAAWIHLDWFIGLRPGARIGAYIHWPVLLGLIAGAYLFVVLVNRIAARLTAWEAAYRGLRLPVDVVLRGLDYHAAHYLPVGLLAAGTVLAYRLLLPHSPARGVDWGPIYLYVLCGEVVLGALYLFKTYWTAMRNMMFASR